MPTTPFSYLAPTAANHFRLYFHAAILRLVDPLAQAFGSLEKLCEAFPFFGAYVSDLAAHGLEGIASDAAPQRWRGLLEEWEAAANLHLPLRALREAGHDHETLTLLLTIGLAEEDGRFGAVFKALLGGSQSRPTLGLLSAWFSSLDNVRGEVRRLMANGLLEPINPDAPQAEVALRVPAAVWEALRGETHGQPIGWARYHAPRTLLAFDELVVSDAVRRQVEHLTALLGTANCPALLVRGPRHNGRRTLVGAVARELRRGLLEIAQPDLLAHLPQAGALCVLLPALPVCVLDLAPGETFSLPALAGYAGPVAVVAGQPGGLEGEGVEHAVTVTLDLPDANTRQRHWTRTLGTTVEGAPNLGERYRLTSGNIHRAATLARAQAALHQRGTVTLEDIQHASRALNRQALDTLAARVEPLGDWSQCAVAPATLQELHSLESRCRSRERLPAVVGPALGAQLNAGVRALFTGPSGTGKTLAARILAAVLQIDLYRLDLSAVVNKYIGETEKNLSQLFARAEELDVMLLLDEGDALLTQRTSVQSSNDRYANLETNYLLQRLEAFEGILIVTTNAQQRIDSAFQRRMDVVVEFHAPEAEERFAIWQLHLPWPNAIDDGYLGEVARRCALSGGQIRNAALHAALLALNNGGVVGQAYLEAAVQREYRKLGAPCPLRPAGVTGRYLVQPGK